MGLVDRVPVVDQHRHGASRVDISQVLNALMRIIDEVLFYSEEEIHLCLPSAA